MKQQARDAIEEKEKLDIKLIDAQERLKAMEIEKEKFEGDYLKRTSIQTNFFYKSIITIIFFFAIGFKEQMVEQEQTLIVFKQRFREAQDELEELRSLIQDQAAQLEDYRNKYLQVLFVTFILRFII